MSVPEAHSAGLSVFALLLIVSLINVLFSVQMSRLLWLILIPMVMHRLFSFGIIHVPISVSQIMGEAALEQDQKVGVGIAVNYR